MTTKPRKKKLTLREYRGALARLKQNGLISKSIDARSHKPTRHMLAQISKFKDVVAGHAKAVKLPSKQKAGEYSGDHLTKFDRVVVFANKDEPARFDPYRDQIIVRRRSHLPDVDKFRQIIPPNRADEIPLLPDDTFDTVYRYAMPFRRGSFTYRIFADSLQEISALMMQYDPKEGGRFANWRSYVELVEFDRDDIPEDEFEIDRSEVYGSEDAGRAAYDRRRKAKAQPRDARGRFVKKEATRSATKGRAKKSKSRS